MKHLRAAGVRGHGALLRPGSTLGGAARGMCVVAACLALACAEKVNDGEETGTAPSGTGSASAPSSGDSGDSASNGDDATPAPSQLDAAAVLDDPGAQLGDDATLDDATLDDDVPAADDAFAGDDANVGADDGAASDSGTPDAMEDDAPPRDAGVADGPVPADGSATDAGTLGSADPENEVVDEDSLFEPADLPNTEVGGGAEGLNLVAFTLRQHATGAAFYAAVRNDGESPACNAGIVVTFYDASDQSIATSGVGLQSGRLYRLNDDSGSVVGCVAPGQIAMAASTSVPESVVLADLGRLEHNFPAFGLDVVPLEVATLSDLAEEKTAAGSIYRGTLTNVFDASLSEPSVTIFSLNRVGRPLGVVTVSDTVELAPGESWEFETSALAQAGSDFVAFPTARLVTD